MRGTIPQTGGCGITRPGYPRAGMIVVLLLLLIAAVVVAVLVTTIALGRGGTVGPTMGRAEAERQASLEAERVLGERYRNGEIGLEEFERELASLLERRERRDAPGS